MQAECYHRVIDPWTNKPIAAWGWLRERKDGPDKYWVSIDNLLFAGAPYQIFSRRDWAEEFYYERTRLLRAKCNSRRVRGPQRRLKRQAHVAGVGK